MQLLISINLFQYEFVDIDILQQVNDRMDKSDELVEKGYKKLAKQIKGTKQSILYDLNNKIEVVKNTILINKGPAPGENLKKYKDSLGIRLPISDYDAFIEFDSKVEVNNDVSTALVC